VPGRLFSPHFLVKLRALTAADGGILVVNFYGDPDAEPAQRLARSLHKVFGNIRCASIGLCRCLCGRSFVSASAMCHQVELAR
jgi:spermidine synthase